MESGLTVEERSGGAPRCALSITNLRKTFVGSQALKGVDLEVQAGEIHALLGENGSGKSTLIKILSGYHQPDAGGRVLIDSRPLEFGSSEASYHLGCRFVHQDLGLIATSSVLDNLCLNGGFPTRWGTVKSAQAKRMASADLARVGLDVDPSAPVRLVSPAQKTGVAVARALRQLGRDAEVKLLVLDEPTATLPESEVEQLLETVRRVAARGIGVLYVTHRLDEVFQLAQNATVLRDGLKVATRPVESLDRRTLVSLLVGTELEEVRAASQTLHSEHGEAVLRVKDLVAGPLTGVSFEARAGDIIGIAGITGSGRDAILGAVFGAVEREAGTVTVGDTVVPSFNPRSAMDAGMGYLPAERKTQGAIMEFSARENLTLSNLRPFWARGRLRRRGETEEAKAWFKRLDVRPNQAYEAPIMTFSGGNQQKIIFGKWLRRNPAVLLLDEPTQGVDIGAKAALHRQLLNAASEGAAVIISSSDVDELVAVCHQVLVMRRGKIVAHLRNDEITVAGISHESLGAGEEVAIS